MAPKIDILGGHNMARELNQSIASHRREMLEFAHELIVIPPENPPGRAAKECAGMLRDRLRCMGFSTEPKTPGGSVRSFYGRGSSGMKSGLVAIIYAVRAIQECNLNAHSGTTRNA
jgi:acetylornithine deacetylase/succinyl-diaminopimelate desuccinylase-like protein